MVWAQIEKHRVVNLDMVVEVQFSDVEAGGKPGASVHLVTGERVFAFGEYAVELEKWIGLGSIRPEKEGGKEG